jgi:hypothetical protein
MQLTTNIQIVLEHVHLISAQPHSLKPTKLD